MRREILISKNRKVHLQRVNYKLFACLCLLEEDVKVECFLRPSNSCEPETKVNVLLLNPIVIRIVNLSYCLI